MLSCVLLCAFLQTTVSPTPNNVNTVLLRRSDVVTFAGVQQWLAVHMGLHLQLLAGTFVVCRAEDIPLPGDAQESERLAVPLRFRQVAAVEIPADGLRQPESIVVLLEGGGEVQAGRLSELAQEEIPCYEVSSSTR